MQFCEWLHQHTADELFLHNILWTVESCVTREGVFNVNNSHLLARDNHHAIFEREYEVLFTLAFQLESSGTLSGPLSATWPAKCSTISWFSGNCCTGAAWRYASSCEAKFWFQHHGAPVHYGKYVRQWLDETYPGRWLGRRGPIELRTPSPDLTPMTIFLWGTPGRARFCSPSRDYRWSRGKASSSCDSGRCQ
jgi:hypothetical protein